MLALTAFWICLSIALRYDITSIWWLFGIMTIDMILRFLCRVSEHIKKE